MKRLSVLMLIWLFTATAFASDAGTKFAVAIERGDLDAIKALVEGGASPDTPIEYGENKITPLMKACWDGEIEIATYLLDQGADVNVQNADGQTPVSNAVQRDRVEILQLLIDRGAKVNITDIRQFTPMTTAAAAGNLEIIRVLAKAGADLKAETYGLTPLMFAVASKKIDTVKLLVELGASVDQVSSVSGQTALFSAIYAASPELVQALIDLKANVNFRTKDGETPLKAAGKGDQEDLIAILKAAGAKQ